MKKILKKQREVAQTWSDVSGKPFEHEIPEVELKIYFGYGSKYDESELELHFTDKEFEPILALIKLKLCNKSKKFLRSQLTTKSANNKLLCTELINKLTD